MRSTELKGVIRSGLDEIRVIDSHDHIESLEFARSAENQLFRTLARSFILQDLTNTGVRDARWKATVSGGIEGWLGLKRYIQLCRNTAYFRSFLIAVRDLLGLEVYELSDDNWESVSHALVAATQQKNWYRYVLRERANIDVVLWDQTPTEPEWPLIDNELFVPMARFDRFAWTPTAEHKRDLGQRFGSEPTTLADLLDLLDYAFEQTVEGGVGCIKIGAAYWRILHFGEGSRAEASRVFNASAEDISYDAMLAFQDFIYAQIIQRCIAANLPMQIHTGMQANPNYLYNGYPLHLEETVIRYPEANFVLLHASYPFIEHATSLASKYPNVYVEGSWLPVLSPSAYRRTVSEWLDAVPVEKILVWGGDALRVEMTYGSLMMAKDIVADVLAEKVELGYFSEIEALQIANRIFRENALELFRTDEVRRKRMKTTGRRAVRQDRVA